MIDGPSKIVFDTQIALKVALGEQSNARALGYAGVGACVSGFAAMEDVMEIARKPMPEMVLTRFRP